MEHPFYDKHSRVSTSSGSMVHYYSRGLETVSKGNPILVLVHGYPQSFRHLIPLLPPELALFVPDLPGYGNSTPSTKGHTKDVIGSAILEALQSSLPSKPILSSPQKIILAGHDRGARVCHRLAVDAPTHTPFSILSVVFLDIVPTAAQWATFDSSRGASGGFHWPFLANVDLATTMIMSQGGGWWCREMISRWSGANEQRLRKLMEEDALKRYAGHFEKEETVRASCEDYRSGAFEDVEAQERDQREGKKIGMPVLVIFSQDYSGKRHDVSEVWAEWVTKGVLLDVQGIGDGAGHFLSEEAPEEVAHILNDWVPKCIKMYS